MSYADEPEPRNWGVFGMRIAIAAGMILVICVVGGVIYGVNYYKNLPSPEQKTAQNAAARYEFLEEQKASDDDLCTAAAAAKAAYANVQDSNNYRYWVQKAQAACLTADLNRRLSRGSD